MANSALRRGESYEVGTRTKYQSEDVARTYHGEFTRFSLSPNDLFVRLVTWGERRAIAFCLATIRPSAARIADIPCGTGKLLPLFSEHRFDVIGGDVSKEMIAVAKEISNGIHQPFDFVRLDATRLPFRSASLDAVVCLRLLHRVPTQIKSGILAELRRTSRRYAILSYGRRSLWQTIRMRARQLLTGRLTVPFALTRESMRALLAEHGWRIVAERPVLAVLSAESVLLLEKD